MKIAYLLGSLNRGGTETLMLDVMRHAKSQQLNAIAVYRKSGELENEFLHSGVKFIKINSTHLFKYIIKLRSLIQIEKVDIIHAQQPLDALLAKWSCVGLNIKIILTLHGFDYAHNKKGLTILKYILKRTDLNIYVSTFQKEYYSHKYGLKKQKQLVVYNGISFDKFKQTEIPKKSEKLRAELNIATNSIILGSVGNFVEVRDQLTICRFLNLLKQENIDYHFIFIGKKSDSKPELYNRCVEYCRQVGISEKVSFLGSRNDIPEILPQLDAFIYSTDHDTFGIAVIEAIATGIPVFVNDWAVMTEITDAGKYATIYKTKDEADLLQHFLLFLENKQAYKQEAKDAAHLVMEQYSIERHIENLKQIYSMQRKE